MSRVLISGGAGFIGCHLAKHLLETTDASIVLTDNLFRGKMNEDLVKLLEDSRVTFIEADLTDQAAYTKLGNGYDHVYHLAAVNGTKLFYEIPHEVLRINTLTLVFMLEWFRRENREGKFLFTSSSEVYAGALEAFGTLPIPTPENVPLVIADPYNPRSSYDATKLVGEPFVIHYAKQYDFRAVIVRPHNFYGPRAGYEHVIPEYCERVMKRVDPFPVFGNDTRTFCYIGDVVRAMRMLMESTATDHQPIETVHIGASEEITMTELAERLFTVTGWHPASLEVKPSPQGSVKRRLADISKIEKLVGWKPEISLEEGLKLTYDWYSTHPKPEKTA
ncbi:MAG: NAD-dependent epimerase/dehydratase family protein [Patescibacteria group bacterium]